jgi:hypothetical protein
VKLVQVLSRLALLSLAAAAFIGLTEMYGTSVRLPLPNPQWQAGRRHRASWPQSNQLPSGIGEFIAEGIGFTLCAAVGRIVLRLRLSPVSPSEGKMISLNLHRGTPGLPKR